MFKKPMTIQAKKIIESLKSYDHDIILQFHILSEKENNLMNY